MMTVLKIFLEVLFGLGAGSLTAAGYFAIITSVGLINRMADVTHSKNRLLLYEEMIIWGVILGNAVFIFDIHVPVAAVGTVIFGLLSGMFVGLLVVCLAETTKALPIFIRRVRIGAGLGVIILMVGLGKAVGHLLYYFFLYD